MLQCGFEDVPVSNRRACRGVIKAWGRRSKGRVLVEAARAVITEEIGRDDLGGRLAEPAGAMRYLRCRS